MIPTMKTITRKNCPENFSLHNLSTSRTYIKGWTDIKIDPDFLEESSHEIANLLGGRQTTKSRIAFNIRNTPISHWASDRIIFDGKNWTYCAGQDYTAEIKVIRKALAD